MKIYPVKAFTDNYIWAVHANDSNHILVVDPGDANPVIDYVEAHNLTLTTILITHHHNDHIGGVKKLKEKYNCQVYAAKNEQFSFSDYELENEQEISIFNSQLNFEIIHLPGHTLKHIAYYDSGNEILFCGDTLFRAGCGRMFEGTPEQFYSSLQKLAKLPKNTKVYCTHEYTLSNLAFAKFIEPDNQQIHKLLEKCNQLRKTDKATLPSTIDSELETNPFLRCHIKEVETRINQLSKKNYKQSHEIFASMRRLKDNF